MPKWEYCEIRKVGVSAPIIGKPEFCFLALLYTTGGASILLQSETWKADDWNREVQYLESLIAKLGKDGWEAFSFPNFHPDSRGFFRRPIVE